MTLMFNKIVAMKIVEKEIRRLRFELFVSVVAAIVAMACLVYVV